MPTPITRTSFECRICRSSGIFPVYRAREMMYGTREPFDYVLCNACGCLQIAEIPADLTRHYPPDYYSQRARDEPPHIGGVKGAVARWYCRSAAIRPGSALESALRAQLPVPTDFVDFGTYLIEARLQSASERILDVGCGSSPHRLAAFRRCGFTAVEGVDPFIAADTEYHGIPVFKGTIDQADGVFGLIMFHHSLEHVPDPAASLREAARLLRSGGTCLVRIPVMNTWFWSTYGVDWVELDAPRHLYLMAPQTIDALAVAAGFRVRKTVYDSQGWEIAASCQYQADIPLRDKRSFAHGAAGSIFSLAQLEEFEAQAVALNEAGNAGRAQFYLEKA